MTNMLVLASLAIAHDVFLAELSNDGTFSWLLIFYGITVVSFDKGRSWVMLALSLRLLLCQKQIEIL